MYKKLLAFLHFAAMILILPFIGATAHTIFGMSVESGPISYVVVMLGALSVSSFMLIRYYNRHYSASIFLAAGLAIPAILGSKPGNASAWFVSGETIAVISTLYFLIGIDACMRLLTRSNYPRPVR